MISVGQPLAAHVPSEIQRRSSIAALYNPVWTAGITGPNDFALAVAGFSAPVHVAIAALAGGGPKFGWRELDRGFLSKQLAAKSHGSHLVDVRFGS